MDSPLAIVIFDEEPRCTLRHASREWLVSSSACIVWSVVEGLTRPYEHPVTTWTGDWQIAQAAHQAPKDDSAKQQTGKGVTILFARSEG